mmetsp:Transcript_46029/g.99686  ORF Transcript_46029/g.99686 Transcript_46029/m.99686 type:complete len:214 (+) Transcript_46029:11-652(+)
MNAVEHLQQQIKATEAYRQKLEADVAATRNQEIPLRQRLRELQEAEHAQIQEVSELQKSMDSEKGAVEARVRELEAANRGERARRENAEAREHNARAQLLSISEWQRRDAERDALLIRRYATQLETVADAKRTTALLHELAGESDPRLAELSADLQPPAEAPRVPMVDPRAIQVPMIHPTPGPGFMPPGALLPAFAPAGQVRMMPMAPHPWVQ